MIAPVSSEEAQASIRRNTRGLLGRFPNGNPPNHHHHHHQKAIRALAPPRRHQIGALGFPSLAAMGNFRNGWVVDWSMVRRDLEDNHILTGLSDFPITSHFSVVIRNLWALDWSGN
jgi:hypothetical protein